MSKTTTITTIVKTKSKVTLSIALIGLLVITALTPGCKKSNSTTSASTAPYCRVESATILARVNSGLVVINNLLTQTPPQLTAQELANQLLDIAWGVKYTFENSSFQQQLEVLHLDTPLVDPALTSSPTTPQAPQLHQLETDLIRLKAELELQAVTCKSPAASKAAEVANALGKELLAQSETNTQNSSDFTLTQNQINTAIENTKDIRAADITKSGPINSTLFAIAKWNIKVNGSTACLVLPFSQTLPQVLDHACQPTASSNKRAREKE